MASTGASAPIGVRERLDKWLTPTVISVAVTLWIAMSEIDRRIAGLWMTKAAMAG